MAVLRGRETYSGLNVSVHRRVVCRGVRTACCIELTVQFLFLFGAKYRKLRRGGLVASVRHVRRLRNCSAEGDKIWHILHCMCPSERFVATWNFIVPFENCHRTLWKVSSYALKSVIVPFEKCQCTLWKVSLYPLTSVIVPFEKCHSTLWKARRFKKKGNNRRYNYLIYLCNYI